MTQTPEKEPAKVPEGVTEIPTEPEFEAPTEMVKSGMVTPTQTSFNAQVTDDQGQPLIQTPKDTSVTITVPKTQAELETMSKGPPEKSSTWFAVTWIRKIRKAFKEGLKVVVGK